MPRFRDLILLLVSLGLVILGVTLIVGQTEREMAAERETQRRATMEEQQRKIAQEQERQTALRLQQKQQAEETRRQRPGMRGCVALS